MWLLWIYRDARMFAWFPKMIVRAQVFAVSLIFLKRGSEFGSEMGFIIAVQKGRSVCYHLLSMANKHNAKLADTADNEQMKKHDFIILSPFFFIFRTANFCCRKNIAIRRLLWWRYPRPMNQIYVFSDILSSWDTQAWSRGSRTGNFTERGAAGVSVAARD